MTKLILYSISLLFLAAGLSDERARAADWPRFRGPDGTGIGAGTGFPVEFGPDKNLAWKIAVMKGHSSPVLAGDQVYLTAADDKELLTLAYDAATGRELWRRALPRARTASMNPLNSAATPTPAADAGGVVVFFQDFGLAAYHKDGRPAWKLPLPAVGNAHGMGSSPIQAGKLAIQVLAGDGGSRVVAVGRHSGEKAWERPLQFVTFSTPVMAKGAGGEPLAVVVSSGEAIAFRLADGEPAWWLNEIPAQPCGSPFTSGGGEVVYLGAPTLGEEGRKVWRDFDQLLKQWDVNGDGRIAKDEMKQRGGPVEFFPQLDVNPDGFYDRAEHDRAWKVGDLPHMMGALRAAGQGDRKGDLLWVQRRYIPQVPSPLVYQDVFYAIRNGGVAVSLDAKTGALHKEGRISAAFGAVYSSPVAADGRIYAANRAGKIAVLKAGPQWEVLALNDLGEEIFATPALVDGRIFVRSAGHLWCFRTPSGN